MEPIGQAKIIFQHGDFLMIKMEYIWMFINNGGCYLYEDNNMVGASFKFQTKENLSEDYAGSNWLYTIVNDSLIEKTMAAGGNTYYFIKRDKAHFNQILDLGSCD